jgi:hypothetical protein
VAKKKKRGKKRAAKRKPAEMGANKKGAGEWDQLYAQHR